MKAIMVLFDSLNRHMLPPYGCEWVHAPNFERLAKQSVVFERCFAGSMDCMSARREFHTGRYNFLHRCGGPLEPYDDSMPEILKWNDIYAHLVSDFYLYWREGGANYHTRYNSWEVSRGQGGDPWIGELNDPDIPNPNPQRTDAESRQNWINRSFMEEVKYQPMPKTFSMSIDFIKRNFNRDDWFLHIDTMSPHEPYFVDKKYQEFYAELADFKGDRYDWPEYGKVTQPKAAVRFLRLMNAAFISMCDEYLGRLLDVMDKYYMWSDTMLILLSDHGFLLGEHGWWGRCRMPYFNEIVMTPLFIWDPRCGRKGEKCWSLVQSMDITPTLLDFFSLEVPPNMQGINIRDAIESDSEIRSLALFGGHGSHVNVTDGRYVYMRAPVSKENKPLFNYTLLPLHQQRTYSVEEIRSVRLHKPFCFSKDCPVLKIDASSSNEWRRAYEFGNLLYDLERDPAQNEPIENRGSENMMIRHLIDIMKQSDCPPEQFERLGLPLL